MTAISQTTFANAFSWMKIYWFWSKFHWSVSPMAQLAIFQHASDNGLAPTTRQAMICTNADPIHWRIHAARRADEFYHGSDNGLSPNDVILMVRSVNEFLLVKLAQFVMVCHKFWHVQIIVQVRTTIFHNIWIVWSSTLAHGCDLKLYWITHSSSCKVVVSVFPK